MFNKIKEWLFGPHAAAEPPKPIETPYKVEAPTPVVVEAAPTPVVVEAAVAPVVVQPDPAPAVTKKPSTTKKAPPAAMKASVKPKTPAKPRAKKAK